MAGLRFTELKSRPLEFLDFTSVTLDEFQQLVLPFETAFHARMTAWRMDGKPRTARRFTVYKNCPLPTPEDRLLFILVYLKTYARLPPFAHDGTERRIVRPQDAPAQTACYSGKKKDHTVKNVLLVNALLVILFLSDTHGGRTHDLRIAEATPYPLPAGSGLLQDLGFLSFTLPEGEILMPTQKLRGGELPLEQDLANQALHQRRLRIEHVNSSVKRCRIVEDRMRLWKEGVRDLVMEICCALHNFRVRLHPWLPMI